MSPAQLRFFRKREAAANRQLTAAYEGLGGRVNHGALGLLLSIRAQQNRNKRRGIA